MARRLTRTTAWRHASTPSLALRLRSLTASTSNASFTINDIDASVDTEPLVYSFNSASAAYMPDFGKRFDFSSCVTRFPGIDIAKY